MFSHHFDLWLIHFVFSRILILPLTLSTLHTFHSLFSHTICADAVAAVVVWAIILLNIDVVNLKRVNEIFGFCAYRNELALRIHRLHSLVS